MVLKQYYLGCLAHGSYLIADERTRQAVVVDPQRDIDQYVRDAEAGGYTIKYVVLTHFHADFLAGHIELRNRAGARIVMGVRAEAEFDFHAARDGESIDLGDVRLQVLETPGHTPEGISLLVFDRTQSNEAPHAVLTGDTLFIGDVGRPDLLASIGVTADELSEMLYHSLHKFRELPDATLVYPAHGAGSLCGKSIGKETFSTIGEQRQSNYALQPMSKPEFIALVTADQPDAPAYFSLDAVLNAQERPTLDETLKRELKPLTLDQVLELQRTGAQILDVRDAIDFASTHLTGSINIGLGGQYATWAGTVLDHALPIVIIADPGRENEAAMRLGRIGFDNVAGFLQHGLFSLTSNPTLATSTERLSPALAAERLASSSAPIAIDVRTPNEHQQRSIPGSLSIPLNHLAERIVDIPKARPLVVYCEGGYRSSIASSLLQLHSFPVSEIAGGIAAWESAHLPTEHPIPTPQD